MGRLRLPKRWNSIYARLLATYLLLTTLATTLMAGYILLSFYDYFIQVRQSDLENWTAALTETVADALADQDRRRVEILVQRYGAPDNVTLRVLTPDGRLLATSSPQTDWQVTQWLQIPGMREALQDQSSRGIAKGIFSDDDRLYSTRLITHNDQVLGILRMSITLKQFQRQFAQVIWTILGTLVGTILLCALISERLARSLSRPVELMQHFAIRVGSGHFDDKLIIRQSNELEQLAAELNRMSARLASLDQERRAFLANVSHELRTPISNVQVTVEALKHGAYEETELRDRFFQTIEDETKRLSRLLHDLLDLGRLEAGVSHLERQIISLPSLVTRAVMAMESRMQAQGIATQVNVAPICVNVDPERLLQAILNILDNAIKYSRPNSSIFISGSREGKWAQLAIRDQGPGIHASDLPRIFEQFYSSDPSRQGNSAGLGLAIARRIIEAHGGSITASSDAGQGAIFTLYLPLREEPDRTLERSQII
ncbi:two-component sensor histidine kinase [Leptolyngbya sp. 'hensonii']|uniref:sensor histidine kinase n=1 Tax=Leptolyngbya sp. 'hensonii' TaxID=1922337 RepID=UPI00094F8B46|nr:HAMP domain-containing sensor histidine kinase [Leptolyngbya sp. 'hensonii']OLP15539.1 two-component sensor histidine kinase [Leptolyngbya sp. 'hensonii']